MNSFIHKNTSVLNRLNPHTQPKVTIMPKLTVNTPGDQYEQEADAMADTVIHMPVTEHNAMPETGIIGTSVQRKCSSCEEENKKKRPIMRKADFASGGRQASDTLISSLNAAKGGGSSLPPGTKRFMENAFSTDFSGVRIHTDSAAADLSSSITARAFTHGQDIYFNNGEYNPTTTGGKFLLAHELTHTVQQGTGVSRMLLQKTPAPTQAARRQAIISNARSRAFHRVSVAYLRINGTSPHFNQHEELRTVRGLIAPDIVNFSQIVEIVGSILMRLSSDSNIEIGPEITQCTGEMGWNAYVSGNRLPIHLCDRFFRESEEQQIRTLIHEAAHAVGIGQPEGESYFPLFDCSVSDADNWAVADAWARYINCISGQTPDAGEPVTVRTPAHP